MTIPVKKEPLIVSLETPRERCAFCGRTTLFWHARSNNPVCPECARSHKVTELKNWFKGGKPYRQRG